MLRLCCKITISSKKLGKELVFTAVNSCEIVSSIKTLTDTAKLTLPRKVYHNGELLSLKSSSIVARGDKITIQLGYNDEKDLKTVFKGSVVRVASDFPLQLECEDYMFDLKKQPVAPMEFKEGITLPEVMDYLGFKDHKASGITLGAFKISESTTAAKVLQKIQSSYSLDDVCFFYHNGNFYCDIKAWKDNTKQLKPHKLHIGGEKANIISHTLTYRDKEDIDIKLEVSSLQPNEKKSKDDEDKKEVVHKVEAGDGATVIKYNLNGITDKKELEDRAKEKLDRLKEKLLQGKITLFGIPLIFIGDKVELKDNVEEHEEREGVYRVDAVTTKFGYSTGYRQEIELGEKQK